MVDLMSAECILDDFNDMPGASYKPVWGTVDLLAKDKILDKTVISSAGEFSWANLPDFEKLKSMGVDLNPEPEYFEPSNKFYIAIGSTRMARVYFESSRLACFSIDGKFPARNNPYSSECESCPNNGDFGQTSTAKQPCRQQVHILGLSQDFMPVLLRLRVGAIPSFTDFRLTLASVMGEEGSNWTPYGVLIPISVGTKTFKNASGLTYVPVFPSAAELKALPRLAEDEAESVKALLGMLKTSFHPKFIPDYKPGRKIGGATGGDELRGRLSGVQRVVGEIPESMSNAAPAASRLNRPTGNFFKPQE